MNQTLQATRTTLVYDEFSLKLYFLAKDVLKEAVHISVTVQPGMTVSLFRNPAHFDLNASQSSVGAGAHRVHEAFHVGRRCSFRAV